MKDVRLDSIKCEFCDKKQKSVSAIIEETKEDICKNYCKYPTLPVPEGRTENWLIEDDDSPCMNCPLNNL